MSRQAALDAVWQEQIIQEWQHWRAFLGANQALLDARVADESAQFELTDTDAQEANARLVIQSLPPTLRTRFEGVLERYRREMQQQMDQERRAQGLRGNADPDETERETLAQLLRECEGLSTEDGLGRVPRDDGDWYGLDITSLLDVPADAYTIKGNVAPKQKQMAMISIGGVAVLVLLAFLLWPRSAPAAVIYSDVPLVNGAVTTTWQPVKVSYTQNGSEGSAPAWRAGARRRADHPDYCADRSGGVMAPDVLNSPELLNALGMIKIFAQGIAFLGIILWALSKMVSPVFPEIGERFNDAIVRIVMGAIAFNVIQTIGEAFQQW